MTTRHTAIAIVIAAVGTLGLTACEAPADPCSTSMPAPSAAEIAKVEQGLEVDESIIVNGNEVECVLVQTRGGGFGWFSEASD